MKKKLSWNYSQVCWLLPSPGKHQSLASLYNKGNAQPAWNGGQSIYREEGDIEPDLAASGGYIYLNKGCLFCFSTSKNQLIFSV